MVQRWRAVNVLLLVGLMALGALWELVLAPTGKGYWAVKTLPLLCAVPGVLRHRLYTSRWLSLALWLYVLEGLVRATSEGGLGRSLAWGQTLLAVALFTTLTLYIRRRLRDGRESSQFPH